MMDMFMLSSVTTINAGLAPKKSTINIDHVKSAFTLQEQGKFVTTIGKCRRYRKYFASSIT